MIPPRFGYQRANDVEEAIQLLKQHGEDAHLLAGGHSLLPLLKTRDLHPSLLIDIGRIEELRRIALEMDHVVLGALTTHAAIEHSPDLAALVPLLPQTAPHIADPMVRNRGTVGGSLAYADEGADWPAAMLALEAEFIARGPAGNRSIPVDEFFVGERRTALASNEVLCEIRLPHLATDTGTSYLKLRHPASGYALVGVAAVLQADDGGRCLSCRIALTGAGPVPARLKAAENRLEGQPLTAETIATAADAAPDGIELKGDLYASAGYRAQLVRVYVRRVLEDAWQQLMHIDVRTR